MNCDARQLQILLRRAIKLPQLWAQRPSLQPTRLVHNVQGSGGTELAVGEWLGAGRGLSMFLSTEPLWLSKDLCCTSAQLWQPTCPSGKGSVIQLQAYNINTGTGQVSQSGFLSRYPTAKLLCARRIHVAIFGLRPEYLPTGVPNIWPHPSITEHRNQADPDNR